MQIIRVKVDGLPLFDDSLDINFLTESRVTVDEKHELIRLFNNFYVNRTLTFTGLNASGKTQILNILAFSLKLLQAESINYKPAINITPGNDYNVLNIDVTDEITFSIYFHHGDSLYKLETVITREVDSGTNENRYKIISENLKRKTITTKIRSKKDIFTFNDDTTIEVDVRDNNKERFLALNSDVSMIQVYYKQKKISKIFYSDLLSYTNFNLLSGLGKVPKELVEFLDPSIEKVEFKKNNSSKAINVSIKFKHSHRDLYLDSIAELNTVLSSGTVKGLGLFMNAMLTLSKGGIMIVDELENHFNREIASTLIRWFLDRKVNINNAVLVYSMHYAELLDILERNDSIYVVSKSSHISIERFSKVLKRNDIRRSVQFINGLLSSTAPSYSSENNLRKFFIAKQKENLAETEENAE